VPDDAQKNSFLLQVPFNLHSTVEHAKDIDIAMGTGEALRRAGKSLESFSRLQLDYPWR